ncbi:hypothetical protein EJ08DRAFT_700134 [Tothia fuscella]|uniref:Uncharacterized protein n=1 Tax=Tothia fuscella TaxID=1048955 RepID=A0A9P4TW87_9PEZI|nr:hypothetical protein EJ08DRAFT_700134 [Tothia fuscella]
MNTTGPSTQSRAPINSRMRSTRRFDDEGRRREEVATLWDDAERRPTRERVGRRFRRAMKKGELRVVAVLYQVDSEAVARSTCRPHTETAKLTHYCLDYDYEQCRPVQRRRSSLCSSSSIRKRESAARRRHTILLNQMTSPAFAARPRSSSVHAMAARLAASPQLPLPAPHGPLHQSPKLETVELPEVSDTMPLLAGSRPRTRARGRRAYPRAAENAWWTSLEGNIHVSMGRWRRDEARRRLRRIVDRFSIVWRPLPS